MKRQIITTLIMAAGFLIIWKIAGYEFVVCETIASVLYALYEIIEKLEKK